MAKMNPEVKDRWVAELRSGEYKQGKKRLRTGDAFCCLGVLCNLHAQAHPKIAAKQRTPDLYLDEGGVLPFTVVRWAGLPDQWGGEIEVAGRSAAFPAHNDGGCSFAEIADAIEAQL